MTGEGEADLARLNVSFIDFAVTPLWTALAELAPELDEAMFRLKQNRAHWETLCRK
jgi:hypothetical protein